MSGGIVFGGGMTEEWRPVVGYEGLYEVSSEGRVRSLAQATRGIGRPRRDMILRNGKSAFWYPKVMLKKTGGAKNAQIHQLVLQSFVGPRPDGMVARHLNGDPGDARLSNLAYGTYRENEQDKVTHGTKLYGERCSHSKLTDDKVRAIRKSTDSGVALAAAYGVTPQLISYVRRRHIWRHVA